MLSNRGSSYILTSLPKARNSYGTFFRKFRRLRVDERPFSYIPPTQFEVLISIFNLEIDDQCAIEVVGHFPFPHPSSFCNLVILTLYTNHLFPFSFSCSEPFSKKKATTNISLQLPASHSKPVSSVKCHPLSSNLFASGSHDGTIKIWDIRSSKQALFSLNSDNNKSQNKNGNGDGGLGMNEGEGEKVLTLDWTRDGQTIVSGGEDKKLNVWKGEGIGKSLE